MNEEPRITNPPRYIAIEGVIGAGKTTLAGLLAERLNGQLLLEQFEENPFLADFYLDPARYAFQTQIFFLLSRYRQQQQVAQPDLFHDVLVSDYTFDKDRIFAGLTLSDHELALYESVASALDATVIDPDLLIYLRSDVARLSANIRQRGREMERSISTDYLQRLSEAYTHHTLHRSTLPTIVVDTGSVDFLHDRMALEMLVEEIMRPRGERVRYLGVEEQGAGRRDKGTEGQRD